MQDNISVLGMGQAKFLDFKPDQMDLLPVFMYALTLFPFACKYNVTNCTVQNDLIFNCAH